VQVRGFCGPEPSPDWYKKREADGAKSACPESRNDWASKGVNHAKARKENGYGRDGPPKVFENYLKRRSKDNA
jgi:hypothetical protein